MERQDTTGMCVTKEKEIDGMLAVDRIARDISDGLILINNSGTVLFVNACAASILNNPSLKEGVTYAGFMNEDKENANDAFHQYILDSIYDKESPHSGSIAYNRPDGSVRYLSVKTSYVRSDDGLQQEGILLSFSDITDYHKEKVKHDDTVIVLLGMLSMVAVWDFMVTIWEHLDEPIPSGILTLIIEIMGLTFTVFALRHTSITVADFGLGFKNVKKPVLVNIAVTFAALILMILVKFLGRQLLPTVFNPDTPFFHWDVFRIADLAYIPTVIMQEFLIQGVTLGSVARILPDSYPSAIAVFTTSMFFGSIHIHLGIAYMAGSVLFLSVFGFIYLKQKTVWSLCIPHLLLSWSLRLLWFS